MGKDIAKAVKAMQELMESKGITSPEEAKQFFDDVMSSGEFVIPETGEPDALDYLDMAEQTTSKKEALKYAKMALELDPEMYEAEFVIASLTLKTDGELQAEVERLLEVAEKQLAAVNITREEYAGEYYSLYQTRSYLNLYCIYRDILVKLGKYRKATAVCRDILHLNENDNLGVRYSLMALYAMVEDAPLAEDLYRQYQENSSFMLLPLIALYYRADNAEKAKAYIDLFATQVKGAKKGLQILKKKDMYEINMIAKAQWYQPRSAEEVVMAYCEHAYLYRTMPEFVPWLLANLPAKTKGTGDKGQKIVQIKDAKTGKELKE